MKKEALSRYKEKGGDILILGKPTTTYLLFFRRDTLR